MLLLIFFFSSRRRHTRSKRDWSSDVCSSDLTFVAASPRGENPAERFARVYGIHAQSTLSSGSVRVVETRLAHRDLRASHTLCVAPSHEFRRWTRPDERIAVLKSVNSPLLWARDYRR